MSNGGHFGWVFVCVRGQCTCMHAWVYAYIYVCVYTCMYMYIHASVLSTCSYVFVLVLQNWHAKFVLRSNTEYMADHTC